MGDSGYREWSARLEQDLLTQLSESGILTQDVLISRQALEPGTSKSATMFILGTLGLTLAGGGAAGWDPERTGKVLKATWSVLKRLLPQKTHFKIKQVTPAPKGSSGASELEIEIEAGPEEARKLIDYEKELFEHAKRGPNLQKRGKTDLKSA